MHIALYFPDNLTQVNNGFSAEETLNDKGTKQQNSSSIQSTTFQIQLNVDFS